MRDWGRFTVYGDAETEALIRDVLTRAADCVAGSLRRSSYRALLLIGGYGRGEGGVVFDGERSMPHNNLDLLLVSRWQRGGARQALHQELIGKIRGAVSDCDIDVDLGVVDEWNIRTSRCLVMWYDMRYGHKTLLGDDAFAPGLSRFTEASIDPSDMRNLLVNRGTLMVMNHQLLTSRKLSHTERKMIVRHAMKAIIGCGDVLLYCRDQYNWSYVEKKRRMQQLADVPEVFRRLYDEAAEFRLRPQYSDYLERDLNKWVAEVSAHLGLVHWDIANRLRGRIKPPLDPLGRKEQRRSDEARIAGAFPLVAYHLAESSTRAVLQPMLKMAKARKEPDSQMLRKTYLRDWFGLYDPNAHAIQERLGLQESSPAGAV